MQPIHPIYCYLPIASLFYYFFHFGHYSIIAAGSVRYKAVGAIFYSVVFDIISSAFILQHIKRAIAKKTVEVFFIRYFVAREILAFTILKKFVIL